MKTVVEMWISIVGPVLRAGGHTAQFLIRDHEFVFTNDILKLFCPWVDELLQLGFNGQKLTIFRFKSIAGGHQFIPRLEHPLVVLGDHGYVVKMYVFVQT